MKNSIVCLCDQIRETAFSLHTHLRHGHVKRVYENGMRNRLKKLGLTVVQQAPLTVLDKDGTLLGDFAADLFVQEQIIIELKACRALAAERAAQLLGYLRASRVEHGLLINFGSPKLEIRKYALSAI